MTYKAQNDILISYQRDKHFERMVRYMNISNKIMDAIVVLMDSEIRERIHGKLAPCSNEEFLKAYCNVEPTFESVLFSEFSIDL